MQFIQLLAFIKKKRAMNKILEILGKREKEITRTGSLSDWMQGYPEECWAILCQLEDGDFFEDENEIKFSTTKNEEVGIPKSDGFLQEKTSQKIIYASMDYTIEKNLIEKGVFEITDRVGHYIKIRVEPMIDEVASSENDFKSVRLNSQELALLYSALTKGLFRRPRKGQVYYESHMDTSCTLYFMRDYYTALKKSISHKYLLGEFARSNAESDWNELKNNIDNATISDRDNIEALELYSIYDE
jgi:hypothetical protein